MQDKIVLDILEFLYFVCCEEAGGSITNTSNSVLSFLCSIVKTWGLAWCDQVRAGLIYYHCHSVSALQSSRLEWADRRYKRRMVMQPDVMMRWDTQENCLSIRRTNMSKWNFSTSPHHYAIKLMKVCLWQGREQIMTWVYIYNDLTSVGN